MHWPFALAKGSPFPAPVENRLGYDAARYAAVWKAMETAVGAGKTRAIGTSNMTARKLTDLLKTCAIKPAVNQVESHPFLSQAKELAWLTAQGIVMTAYSCVGGKGQEGRCTPPAQAKCAHSHPPTHPRTHAPCCALCAPGRPLGSPDRPARLVEEGDPAPLHDDVIKAIAAKHSVEPAQVLIRWQMQRGVVVIPKSVTPARIASNLAATALTLDAADLAAIAALDKGLRLIKGYPWLREGETWQALWDLDFLA